MMDALAVVTAAASSSSNHANEEDEERERNTSTRSPESLIDQASPLMFLPPNLVAAATATPVSSASNPMGGTFQALAASVASNPLFSLLFSKFVNGQGQSGQGQEVISEASSPTFSSSPPQLQQQIQATSPAALAQSIDYYNRLRLFTTQHQQQSPPLSQPQWSSATQNLLAAAAMASTLNQSQGKVSGASKIGDASIPTFPQPSSSIVNTTTSNALHPALRGLLLSSQKQASTLNSGSLPAALAAFAASNRGTTRPNNDSVSSKLVAKAASDKMLLKARTRVGRNASLDLRHSAANGATRSSNVKKYRCDVCDKTFSRSNTLITHKRIHTGEKPFRCEHCNRAFRQPGNLTRHRLTHTTVKPFVCAECGKAFNRASNLHTHMRTHYHNTASTLSDWALAMCHHCGKSFASKTDLKTHSCDSSLSSSSSAASSLIPVVTMAD